MKMLRWIGAVPAIVSMFGCVTNMQKGVDTTSAGYVKAGHEATVQLQQHPAGYLQDEGRMWIGGQSAPIKITNALPKVFDSPTSWRGQFHGQRMATLQAVAEYVTTTFGVRVDVSADAQDAAAATVSKAGAPVTSGADAAAGGAAAQSGSWDMQYTGTLRGLLDEVTARTGNSWAWRDGVVSIFHYDTRTFIVAALPGQSTIEDEVTTKSSSGAAGGGSGGGSGGATSSTQTTAAAGQSASMKSSVDVFKAVADTVKSMVSKGGQVALAESMNSVTVTDTPGVLDRVGAYIASLNKRLTAQIFLDVKVYSVDLNQAENYGIDWTSVYNTLSSKYGITAHSISGAPTDAATLGIAVVRPTSANYGTNVLLSALATQGTLAEKTSSVFATLSGQPVPVNVTTETSYLASVQVNQVANAGTSVSVTPGSITTGFSMAVLPVVMDNNDVMLQMSMSLSALASLRTVTAGGPGSPSIEVPSVNSRHFMQRVLLHSGSTLVLSGFEQDTVSGNQRGIGSPKFMLAGGGTASKKDRTVLVIILTPRVG